LVVVKEEKTSEISFRIQKIKKIFTRARDTARRAY
tara:strand:- start:2181 stop:2285 length:105 start_codon:yes stop_codon:yes gene_type:complete